MNYVYCVGLKEYAMFCFLIKIYAFFKRNVNVIAMTKITISVEHFDNLKKFFHYEEPLVALWKLKILHVTINANKGA